MDALRFLVRVAAYAVSVFICTIWIACLLGLWIGREFPEVNPARYMLVTALLAFTVSFFSHVLFYWRTNRGGEMKKLAMISIVSAWGYSPAAAYCGNGYCDDWLNLEKVKNQQVVICDAFTVPPVSMRDYLLKVTKLDPDVNKIRFMDAPQLYRDHVRTDVGFLLTTPICRGGELQSFDHKKVTQSWPDSSVTTDIRGVLMVYKKNGLLKRILTLGLGSDREVIYVHPELYRLIREQPSNQIVN